MTSTLRPLVHHTSAAVVRELTHLTSPWHDQVPPPGHLADLLGLSLHTATQALTHLVQRPTTNATGRPGRRLRWQPPCTPTAPTPPTPNTPRPHNTNPKDTP